MNKYLYRAALGVGLAAIAWVATGYLRSNPLALAMTLLIGAFYTMGALELRRFDQLTSSLDRALGALPEPLASLDDWLAQVPASLRNLVRLRVEGERVALPGPAMTPYLAGLLVLLGMLGTFLGMVVTLNGTGAALERATDLQTMRDSLAAPIKGLGLAFGTSVAGVAGSAMLGLMSALSRRQRLQSAQALDAQIAGSLRRFGRPHQRQASFELLQQQAAVMPALVDRLQTMMAQLESQAKQSNERLLVSQEHFQAQAEAAYRQLAASVDQSLRQSLAESARAAAATLQPVVEATMIGITRETAALHGHIASTVQQQLIGLSSRFEATTGAVVETWTGALSQHERSSEAAAQRLRVSLDGFGEGFEQRSLALVDTLARSHAALNTQMSNVVAAQLDGVSTRLGSVVQGVSTHLQDALAQQARSHEDLSQLTERSLTAAAAHFEQQSGTLLHTLAETHTSQQAAAAAHDEQRLVAWTTTLAALAETQQREWQQAAAMSVRQQAKICETLEQTASRVAGQAEAHAQSTINEISRLVQAASEAPRAAAELVAQLREQLSDSLARDNSMLDERSRIMATLNTLLAAVQHSASGQQAAIDQLVASSSAWLAQAGERFSAQADADAARMQTVAAQLTGSAVEVASLGEAFGVAVELFGQSSQQVVAHLQRVEETLGKSISRSDEQLAYYVAQAREVIDLSLLSQKQIVEDLQRLAARRTAEGSPA